VLIVGFACKIGGRTDSNPTIETETVSTTNSNNSPFSDSGRSRTERSKTNSEAPSDSETESLVKETINDFADAVDQGDFGDFRAKTLSEFQSQFTTAQLNNTFRTFIDKKDAVLPSMNGVNATSANFTDGPRIKTEGGSKILVANGEFPTRPYVVKFETEYEQEDGDWKIRSVRVKM
jgi:hypothetical protein